MLNSSPRNSTLHVWWVSIFNSTVWFTGNTEWMHLVFNGSRWKNRLLHPEEMPRGTGLTHCVLAPLHFKVIKQNFNCNHWSDLSTVLLEPTLFLHYMEGGYVENMNNVILYYYYVMYAMLPYCCDIYADSKEQHWIGCVKGASEKYSQPRSYNTCTNWCNFSMLH